MYMYLYILTCFWNYFAFIAVCQDVCTNRLAALDIEHATEAISNILCSYSAGVWIVDVQTSGPWQFKFQEANTSPPSCPCWFAWSCSMPAGDIPELCLGIGGHIWALSASLCSKVKSEINSRVFARLEDRREAWRGNTFPCRWKRKAANYSATSWFGEDTGRKNEWSPPNSTDKVPRRTWFDTIWVWRGWLSLQCLRVWISNGDNSLWMPHLRLWSLQRMLSSHSVPCQRQELRGSLPWDASNFSELWHQQPIHFARRC